MKHLKVFLASTLSLISLNSSFAESAAPMCLAPKSKEALIEAEAYKTPKKAAVKLKLTQFTVTGDAPKPTFKEVLENSKVAIKGIVDSGNPDRDKKIATNFFKFEKKQTMDASIKNVSGGNEGTYELHLDIEGNKNYVVMNYKFDEATGNFESTGLMDVITFGFYNNLKALNKACLALHEGVTWPVVQLKLAVHFDKAACK